MVCPSLHHLDTFIPMLTARIGSANGVAFDMRQAPAAPALRCGPLPGGAPPLLREGGDTHTDRTFDAFVTNRSAHAVDQHGRRTPASVLTAC
jgi:hypothetical protein